nr:immunoglobulin light chain junction region [Macaca mulatta]MOX52858.1 immunoglobulin light chain junction region [Macaca mulatta]MOX52992.1 immunoglobulin light chain junction region [Macaca mulatta]MOX53097.1 immunoglobulin light chain junction region [Macaca mulatta]
STQNSHIPPTF